MKYKVYKEKARSGSKMATFGIMPAYTEPEMVKVASKRMIKTVQMVWRERKISAKSGRKVLFVQMPEKQQ